MQYIFVLYKRIMKTIKEKYLVMIMYSFDNDMLLEEFTDEDEAVKRLKKLMNDEFNICLTESEYKPTILKEDDVFYFVYEEDATLENYKYYDYATYRVYPLKCEETNNSSNKEERMKTLFYNALVLLSDEMYEYDDYLYTFKKFLLERLEATEEELADFGIEIKDNGTIELS